MPLLIADDGSVGAGFITFLLDVLGQSGQKVVHFFQAQHISKTMLDEVFEYFPAVLIRSP